MASLAECLAHSLSPDPAIRRTAEQHISQAQKQPGFGQLSLGLVQDPNGPPSTRQAAALAFKNWVKREWVPEEDQPDVIPASDRSQLKAQLVPLLVQLSDAPALQVQIQEAVSIIAEADFPDQWNDLIDQLVGRLQGDNWAVNNALLGTAHSIFKRWRAEFRTDALFLQIKFVLERFCQPYLGLWKHVDSMLSNPDNLPPATLKLLARTLLLLVQLYYDLNCQDIPEFFEDNLTDFMALLHKYLVWEHPALVSAQPGSADDEGDEGEEAGDLEKVRAGICEVVELYSQRYLDVFPMMGTFVETVWGLLTRIGRQQCFDILVSKATRFLSVVVKMPSQRKLFEAPATLEAFCEKIVLPNMSLRGFEVEMFEDDPAEYVRRDLEGSDSETRRQAASDFTHALMEQFDKQVTEIVTKYVQAYLQQYAADPVNNWKAKDAAVSLLASVASRSSTASAGVTSTNALVDVVRFFSEHVVQDLQPPSPAAKAPHPIIVADAIKFLHTFRNQLSKEQLLQVVPMLLPQLRSESVVVHTYAANTIERILFIRPGGKLLFGQADIQPHAEQLLNELFRLIRRGTTPQAIASNEALMKCVMRVVLTARQSLTSYETVLNHLVFILGEISKNPSNPKFNHYTFESISAIVRFHSAANPVALTKIEGALFPPFTAILTSDIQEFSPFVFQILSQLLELHSIQGGPLPDTYASLLPPLLMPVLWESRGNVPALVRLLRAFLAADTAKIVADNRIPPLLGVFQKLIGSKINDGYAFELLETMLEFVPISALAQYLRNVFMLIFTRLQQSKTDKFVQGFLHTFMFACALERQELSPETLVQVINSIQTGIFAQILEGVLIPAVPAVPLKRRRVVALGHVALLTRCPSIQNGAYSRLYLPVLASVLRLLTLPLIMTTTNGADGDDAVDAADLEDPGYQAGFSKLGASEAVARKDPLEGFGDPRDALARGLVSTGEASPGKVLEVLREVPANYSQPWMQWAASAGYQLR